MEREIPRKSPAPGKFTAAATNITAASKVTTAVSNTVEYSMVQKFEFPRHRTFPRHFKTGTLLEPIWYPLGLYRLVTVHAVCFIRDTAKFLVSMSHKIAPTFDINCPIFCPIIFLISTFYIYLLNQTLMNTKGVSWYLFYHIIPLLNYIILFIPNMKKILQTSNRFLSNCNIW